MPVYWRSHKSLYVDNKKSYLCCSSDHHICRSIHYLGVFPLFPWWKTGFIPPFTKCLYFQCIFFSCIVTMKRLIKNVCMIQTKSGIFLISFSGERLLYDSSPHKGPKPNDRLMVAYFFVYCVIKKCCKELP